MERDQLIERVSALLRDMLRTRFSGGAHSKLARSLGYVDGYMRALLDAGLVDRETLLVVTGTERHRFSTEERTAVTAS